MTVAHQLWTDDPGRYGPTLRCQAMGDPEEPNPAYSAPPMNDQDDPRETTETLAPPTDREAKTNPENEKPEPRVAVRPPPADPWDTSFLDQDDSTFSRAVKMIADAARANEAARLASEAEAEQRKAFQDQHLSLQSEILTCVQRAEQAQDANFKILSRDVRDLKASDIRQDGRLAQGDERFQRIEQSIADLKDELIALVTRATQDAAVRIEALETELATARADATRVSQTTPSAT